MPFKRCKVLFSLALAVALLSGCVVTAPVKVVKTGAKAGAKVTKAGVKTAVKAGELVIPDGDKKGE